jgi:hypothetical protein
MSLHNAFQDMMNEFVKLTPASCTDDASMSHYNALKTLVTTPGLQAKLTIDSVNENSKNKYLLTRDSEVIVSLFIDTDDPTPLEMTVIIGNAVVETRTVEPNKFLLGIVHEHIVPLVATAYHDVDVKFQRPIRNLYVVGCFLQNVPRRILAQESAVYPIDDSGISWGLRPRDTTSSSPLCRNVSETYHLVHYYKYGMCAANRIMSKHNILQPSHLVIPSIHRMLCYGKEAFDQDNILDKPLYPIHLPKHFALPKLSWSVVKTRLDEYHEELMQITWHPNRFMDWCLSVQDK